jgi:hypothetical protein
MRKSSIARIRKGVTALGAIPYYLLLCPLKEPRRSVEFLENVYRFQRADLLYAGDSHSIPTIPATRLFPGLFEQRVHLLDAAPRAGSTTCFETYLLASLVRYRGARTLFEFGTFEGRTTLQLALNAPEEAIVYTLDLPDEWGATRFRRAYPEEGSARQGKVGARFNGCPEGRKIERLLTDSAAIHIDHLRGRVDFIFVDGDHGYDYVKIDSENAFSMLSPQGVVLWHDYGGMWSAVGRYLREIAGQKKLYHLQETSLVVYGSSIQDPGAK